MKKMLSPLLICGLLACLAGPVAARNDEVTVHFRSAVSPQFVQTLSQTFKAQAVQVDKQTWRFKVPPLKTLDQYSELFASLPTVDDTDPQPVYQVADQINPQAVNIVPIPDRQASPGPSPAASPAPSASPQQNGGLPQGTAVYTQIPLDGGGQMLVDFRPGTPAASIALFYQIYGTRQVRKESFYQYRIQLPPGLNPARAVRIFMLFPYITNAQRLYS
ncbi:MAG TPA: hypothetical protein V6D23_26930 [Candidatus Obscuribacterales bacterium]